MILFTVELQYCISAKTTTHLLKQQLEVPFALTHPLLQAICSLPHEEGYFPPTNQRTLVGQSSRQQRLPGTWGPVEQNSFGRSSFELSEQIGVHEWKEHHLAEAFYVLF